MDLANGVRLSLCLPLAVDDGGVEAGGVHAEGVDQLASLGSGREVGGGGGGIVGVEGGDGAVGVVDQLGGGASHQKRDDCLGDGSLEK